MKALATMLYPYAAMPLLFISCATPKDAARPTNYLVESYDFYFAPTFYTPEHLTVSKNGEEYTITEHIYHGHGGYSPKLIRSTEPEQISQHQWDHVRDFIHAGGFWSDSVQTENHWGHLDATVMRLTGIRGDQEKQVRQYGMYSSVLYNLLDHLREIKPSD